MTSRYSTTKRSLAAITLGLALAMTVSACWNSPYTLTDSTPHLSDDYIQGSWVKSGPNGVVAEYRFLPDHRFIATNIPQLHTPKNDVEDIAVDWKQSMSGTGTWTIDDNDQDPPIVDLTYDPASASTFDPLTQSFTADYSHLLSLEENHVKGLFLTAGDPDEQYRFVFHKQES